MLTIRRSQGGEVELLIAAAACGQRGQDQALLERPHRLLLLDQGHEVGEGRRRRETGALRGVDAETSGRRWGTVRVETLGRAAQYHGAADEEPYAWRH